MAGVGDEQHLHALGAGVREPLVQLVVDEPLAGPGAALGEAAEQQDLVLAVRLAAGDALGLLRAVTGVGEDDEVARRAPGEEVPPRPRDPVPARRIVEQDAHVRDADAA